MTGRSAPRGSAVVLSDLARISGCYAFARHAHLAPPIDPDPGRSGARPRAPGAIVGVQLGEAVTVAQDRPVVATISDRRRNAAVRAMHAERRISRGPVSASPPARPCAYASVLCARPAGWLASSLNAAARACMTDVVSYEYDKRDDSPARRGDVPRARRTRRALPEPVRR